MYTQCPQCHTIFMLAPEQLAARGGLVRCGRCNAVFRADLYLREHPQQPAAQSSIPTNETADALEEFAPNASADTASDAHITTIPTLSDISVRRRGAHTWAWGVGSVVLLSLLVAQYADTYRPEWLQHPQIQPLVHKLCDIVPCSTRPQDPQKIELVEAEVLPHPKYERALRVKALLINRADFIQPFPLMEITLTDNHGQVVARRTFQPRQYLEQPSVSADGMPPQRATRIQLDVTSPGSHAVGYEIRLVVSSS